MKPGALKLDSLLLPLIGLAISLVLWAAHRRKAGHRHARRWHGRGDDARRMDQGPSGPVETWEARKYVVKPLEKREDLDQGILRFTWYSLLIVAKGYFIALAVGTPLGFGAWALEDIHLHVRSDHPGAPTGLAARLDAARRGPLHGSGGRQANEWGALFTIAVCAMWPTVLNTAVGVRAVPQDYLNVARVLRLSRLKTLFKVIIPAALPYMFTGFRLSLGIAWLVIVAVEMLTGRIGIGNFLWNEYNNGLYTSIILCLLTIGAGRLHPGSRHEPDRIRLEIRLVECHSSN